MWKIIVTVSLCLILGKIIRKKDNFVIFGKKKNIYISHAMKINLKFNLHIFKII